MKYERCIIVILRGAHRTQIRTTDGADRSAWAHFREPRVIASGMLTSGFSVLPLGTFGSLMASSFRNKKEYFESTALIV